MVEIKVLIVEDDKTQLNNWAMAVESHNASAADEGFYIDLRLEESKETAIKYIKNHDIDAAVVDIRLGADNNQDGRDVLNDILESELAAVVVLSGEAGVDEILPSWNKKVKKIVKGDNGIDEALGWLKSQIPMLEKIKLAQKEIKREMVKLFTHSIWPRWEAWEITGPLIEPDNDFLKDSLVRHLTAYIYASFMDKTEERAHPEEWYFIPPIKDKIKTGDLLRTGEGKYEVVITPRCDLARDDKNETYQLVECKDVSNEWKGLCAEIDSRKKDLAENKNSGAIPGLQKKLNAANENLRKLTQHKNNSSVYHFLPEIRVQPKEVIGPFLVQFDKLRSVKRAEDGARNLILSQRIATVAPEFLPSLVERLGGFFSRFGTPDYSHPN